jgi:hypothetical protein
MVKDNSNANGDDSSTDVHLVLNGKGGVGRSLVATWLADFLIGRGYKVLGAESLDLVNDDGLTERARYDALIERFATRDAFVLDSGAAAFFPFWSYVVESQAPRAPERTRTDSLLCRMVKSATLPPHFRSVLWTEARAQRLMSQNEIYCDGGAGVHRLEREIQRERVCRPLPSTHRGRGLVLLPVRTLPVHRIVCRQGKGGSGAWSLAAGSHESGSILTRRETPSQLVNDRRKGVHSMGNSLSDMAQQPSDETASRAETAMSLEGL